MPSFNESGPCGPSHSMCQNGGTCMPVEPEPEPEFNWTASWLGDEEDGGQGRCSCPQGWAGPSCEQLALFRADVVYASASVALLLCLLCCMVHGDPERRRVPRSSKLSDEEESRCSCCTNIVTGTMDSLAALPLRWKFAWAVGSLLFLGASLTILVVVPGSFLVILGLWTACILRVGSQYTGSLLEPTGDDEALGSGFELATFTTANIVSRSDHLGTSLLHSSSSRTDAQDVPATWKRHHSMSGYGLGAESGKTWQEKVRDAPHGTRAESAAFSTF